MTINVVRQQLTGMADDISSAVASSTNRSISLTAPSPEVYGDPAVSTSVGTAKDVLETAIRAMAGNAESAAEAVRATAADFATTDTDVASAFSGATGSGSGGAQ